jgi:hypothetical protein
MIDKYNFGMPDASASRVIYLQQFVRVLQEFEVDFADGECECRTVGIAHEAL